MSELRREQRDAEFGWRIPVYVVGFYALAPGLLNMWLLWFSHSRGLDVSQGAIIFALNGLAMSLLPAALIFLPAGRRWFLARRSGGAEVLFSGLRIALCVYILLRFLLKFHDIPLPEFLAFFFKPGLVGAVFASFVFVVVFPGYYARHLANENSRASSRGRDQRETDFREPQGSLAGASMAASAPARFAPVDRVVPTYFVDDPERTAASRARATAPAAARLAAPVARTPSEAARASALLARAQGGSVTTGRGFEDTRGPVRKLLGFAVSSYIAAHFVAYFYFSKAGSFAPNAATIELYDRWIVLFTLGSFVLMVLGMRFLFNPENGTVLRNSPWVRSLIGGGLIAAVLWATSFGALVGGFPTAHAFLSSTTERSEAFLTVVGKGKARSRRSCGWRLIVVGERYVGPVPMSICGADERLYNMVRPGDQVRLLGYMTTLGFKYDAVRLAGR